jgi:uncharacterized protein
MIKRFLISLIIFYKKYISIYLGQNCRYYPSCSEYAVMALQKYNLFKALYKSVLRILRCNPLFKGGVDYP